MLTLWQYLSTMPARHVAGWLSLLLLSPAAKAAVDVLTQKAGRNIFERLGSFFDARSSWLRKYKNADPAAGPRFLGSTGPLVFLTDFWHLADTVYLTGWQVPLVLFLPVSWPAALALLAVLKFGFGGTFQVLYAKVFTSKTESPPPASQP